MSDYDAVELEAQSDKVVSEELPFVLVPEAIIDILGPELGIAGVAVYAAIKMYCNQHTLSAFVLIDTISRKLGCGKSTVGREIKKLVNLNLLTRRRRFNRSSIYTILDPRNSPAIQGNSEVRFLPNRNHSERILPNSECISISERIKETKVLKETKERTIIPLPEIPDWMPMDLWDGFMEVRRKKKAVPTPLAYRLLIDDLTKWHSQGHDVRDILQNAIKRNWTGLFLANPNGNGHHKRGLDLDELYPG